MESIVEATADDNIRVMPTRHRLAADTRTAALYAWIDASLATRGERRLREQPLPAAASFRRFTRIESTAGTCMAIDAPPERENNAQFVRLSAHFRARGIPVPEVLAADLAQGFMLVTDFGDRHLMDVYGTPDEGPALEAALQALVRIQVSPPTDIVPPYTTERLADEFELFPTWFVEGLLGIGPDASTRALFDGTRERLVAAMAAQPTVCVHRDFHSQNLMWRADATIGIVDFQDALWGPLCYDLASLLRDCYHRFSEADIAHWRARYLALARDAGVPVTVDPARFASSLDLTALQRQIKAVGIFARLELRDGRDRHLRDIPPVLAHIADTAARYEPLAPFSRWVREVAEPIAAARLAERQRRR